MRWKEKAKPNQSKENVGIWKCIENPRITIHTMAGFGNKLYLTCYDLPIFARPLHTEDFETAVDRAKTIIATELCTLRGRYAPFIADNSETEIV